MKDIDPVELDRLKVLTQIERAVRLRGFRKIAGIDEAGRGPLAGPVVAAACVIPEECYLAGVDDSKKLTPKKRERLYEDIVSHGSHGTIQYGVGIVSCEEIDRINILQATFQAMRLAVAQLADPPDFLLVDGMELSGISIPSQGIVKGDALSQSIAAASVLAKVTRDRLMLEYDRQWPCYDFASHKGYGTAAHVKKLAIYGPCPIHRRSFAPVRRMPCTHV